MTSARPLALTLATALGLTAAATTTAVAAPPKPVGAQLAEVRAATAHSPSVDAAIADGYEPASPCVPNMGYHFQRGVSAPDQVEATSPEVLVYAPRPNGTLRLVAVEYASTDSTRLFGRSFDPPAPPGEGPPFHTLHAWIWQANPAGTFASHNPNVRCP